MFRCPLVWSLVCTGMIAGSGAMIGCSEAPRGETTVDDGVSTSEATVAAEQPDLTAVPEIGSSPQNAAARAKELFATIVRAAETSDADAWTNAEGQLQALGLAVIPALSERLGDSNPVARELAAMFLAQLGPDAAPAADGLLKLLDDESTFARVNAAAALSTFEGHAERVTPVLVALLADEDTNVRITAATSLKNVSPSGRDAIPALSQSLADTDSRVRAAAAVTLGELGTLATSSLASLRSLGTDDDEQVRTAASRAIKRIDETTRSTRITIPASATE